MHPEFLLYPTYLHQREDLLKDSHQPTLRQLLSDSPADDDSVTFTHWAQVHELLEIDQLGKVEDLAPHHIWTNTYAESRLHWKPMVPLTIMLLRVFQMESPVTVPYIPEYGGCKSWVDIIPTVQLGRMTPVVDDAAFAQMVEAVRGSLGLVAA